jgi:hypothetical protein
MGSRRAGVPRRPPCASQLLTSFSPSPTHFEVRLAAEMLKNVARLSAASACA